MFARCCRGLLRRYSTFLYNYPLVFLILTPIFVIVCGVFSFAPGLGPAFPDFSKPAEGFEPRGTEISKRLVTHQNTLKAAVRENELTCRYPSDINERKRRNLDKNDTIPICDVTSFSSDSVVTVYESGGDLFNVNDLKTICAMEERIVRATPGFDKFCTCPIATPRGTECGPSLSLGSYIARIRNRSSCHSITSEDVRFAKTLLQRCAKAYFAQKLSDEGAPIVCVKNQDIVKTVFNLLVDVDFMRTTTSLKNAMVLSPAQYDSDFARDIYDQHFSDPKYLEQNGVQLAAIKFGNLKYEQFNTQLLLDVVFPAVGLFMIALLLLIYTHSVLVMALTSFSVVASMIVAYFVYHQVLRLDFFPFLNILTFVFLVGIGADDAFVFNDVWSHAKVELPNGSVVDWIEYTLSHAALSMFVTSFTTSAAFYANVVSDITTIRLFGIFSGTSILILYALMITWFPAGVIFVEKLWYSKPTNDKTPAEIEDGELPPDSENSSCPTKVIGESPGSDSVPDSKTSTRAWPFRLYSMIRSKCSQFLRDVFEEWIPSSLRAYPIWLIAFLALGICMACAVMVSPGLKRPTSAEFQLFTDTHILEQYDLKYKSKFRLEQIGVDTFNVYVVFGFKSVDNGNYLDPFDYGELEYDESFDVFRPESQRWFFDELCSNIRKQTFFGKNMSWSCFPEEFKQSCTSSLNWKFPLNETQLRYCLKKFYDQKSCPNFRSDTAGLYFQGNKIKGITLPFPTNFHLTGNFEEVDKFWSEVEDFSSRVLDKAPKGIADGWTISWLHFYSLQKNLSSSTVSSLGVALVIAFAVMLLTSLNWVISVYAILTIIGILATTVGSLVFVGWQLNVLESIVISVAVGLSVDFTLHYAVAYNVSPKKGQVEQVKHALGHVGPAVTLAAMTTFIAGAFMMFSSILVYCQLGQFLTLVMTTSWLFATFFFLSLCYFVGPVGHFGQINSCGGSEIAQEP